MLFKLLLLAYLPVFTVSGCSYSPSSLEFESTDIQQTAFRVRSDFSVALNADEGWAGAVNENVTVYADQPFRIRFEVESVVDANGARRFRLEYRRNDDSWMDVEAEDFPHPDEASPRVSIVSTEAYENGAETADLLSESDAPFSPGAGVNLAVATRSWSGGTSQSEWEWPIVIRRFADGPVTNDEGDRFEFRMIDASGPPIGSSAIPELTLSVPAGHVGGTFVETPGRIGPWEASNGDLYFIMEPTETDNVFMMVKSTDGGASWREVDGANRPGADDLESVDSNLAGHTIHMLHQADRVRYHAFRTSDHPTNPDTWSVRDEVVARPDKPPVQVASIAVRSDGSIVGVYGGPEKIHFKIRSLEGTWGAETIVDADVSPNLSGPQMVVGEDDVVHLAYTGDDGTAWYRRIQPNGALTPREQLSAELGTREADVGSVLPLVFILETNTVVIIYRLASGRLWERRFGDHGPLSQPILVSERDVVRNAVDSDQAGADAIAVGSTVHVLFIDEGSGSIFHTSTAGGIWQPATLQVDRVNAQWIRGALLTRGDGGRVYGYVYDAGSDGGSGMNKYAELSLGGR